MRNLQRQWMSGFGVFAACILACAGDPPQSPSPSLSPVESIAAFNVGTHPLLDLMEPSPVRDICDVWYGNDLCTTGAENLAAGALAFEMPDIILLQEIWDQTLCSDSARPDEVLEPPFACSAGATHQLIRVLPGEYDFGCGADTPVSRDALSCIAFKRTVFIPQGPQGAEPGCTNRDCSGLVEILEPECDSQWGKIVMLRGLTKTGPAVLINVHLFLGLSGEDLACQAEQVQVLSDALDRLSDDTVVIVGGDFNLDLRLPIPAADSLAEMQAEQGLVLLGETECTNQLIPLRLDMIFTRNWMGGTDAACRVSFFNPEDAPPMIDHGLVLCR